MSDALEWEGLPSVERSLESPLKSESKACLASAGCRESIAKACEEGGLPLEQDGRQRISLANEEASACAPEF